LQTLRARPLLNSKVEIRAENLGNVTAHVIASAEASLRRLQVEHIDVFQIHNGPVSGKTTLTGRGYRTLGLDDYAAAIEGLARLRAAGKIGQAGFICRGRDIAEVRGLIETGLFAVINVPYTLLNPTAGFVPPSGLTVERDFGQVIDVAQAAGVGVAVHSALAGGYLTDDDVLGAARHPLARSVDPAAEAARLARRKAASLLFLARETGATLAQAAFRFVLSHDGVTTALGGFSSLSQLEEIALVAGQGPFPLDLMARLKDLWQSDFGLAVRTVPNG
jgi:L-glyceraldehyde 3-phosphate reductase